LEKACEIGTKKKMMMTVLDKEIDIEVNRWKQIVAAMSYLESKYPNKFKVEMMIYGGGSVDYRFKVMTPGGWSTEEEVRLRA